MTESQAERESLPLYDLYTYYIEEMQLFAVANLISICRLLFSNIGTATATHVWLDPIIIIHEIIAWKIELCILNTKSNFSGTVFILTSYSIGTDTPAVLAVWLRTTTRTSSQTDHVSISTAVRLKRHQLQPIRSKYRLIHSKRSNRSPPANKRPPFGLK